MLKYYFICKISILKLWRNYLNYSSNKSIEIFSLSAHPSIPLSVNKLENKLILQIFSFLKKFWRKTQLFYSGFWWKEVSFLFFARGDVLLKEFLKRWHLQRLERKFRLDVTEIIVRVFPSILRKFANFIRRGSFKYNLSCKPARTLRSCCFFDARRR